MPGQRLVVSSVGFGRRWLCYFTVDAVDNAEYQMQATTRFPFGVVEHARIRCAAIDGSLCLVTFG